MPIVTVTENNQPRYYAVTEGDESRPDALVIHYALADSNKREYVEHKLQEEYLKRLTEHAYDCAQLAHFVDNPPDDESLVGNLQIVSRLMAKVLEGAVWLRTYDPFTGLTAEVVKNEKDGEETYGTALRLGDRLASSLDDDSWKDSQHALWDLDPHRRDYFARLENEKAEREATQQFTPAEQKRIDAAAKAIRDVAKRARNRRTNTVANKVLRRPTKKAAKRGAEVQ